MKNITPFLSKSSFKPQMQYVRVHKVKGIKYAMATDSFRLVQHRIDPFFSRFIKDGYYTVKQWKGICKGINRKTPEMLKVQSIVDERMDLERFEPIDYIKIMPKKKDLKPFDGTMSLAGNYLIDFIKMVQTKKGDVIFDFNKIKQTDKAMYFEDDEIKVILMECKI